MAEPAEAATESKTDLAGILARLDGVQSELASEREARARLEGRLETATAPKPKADPPPKKVYTRAELDAAVASGQITDAQRDQYLDKQRDDLVQSEVTRQVEAATAQIMTQTEIQAEIKAYTDAIPSIKDKTSQDFGRVQSEYTDLIRRGLPEGLATQLAAVKAAFGPVPSGTTEKRTARDTDQAGAGGGSAPSKGASDDPLSDLGLNDRQRDYYRRQIDSGRYTPDQVAAEVKGYQGGGAGRARYGRSREAANAR